MTQAKGRLVVLSNKSQYDRFLKEGYAPADFDVLCDNEPFYPFLESRKIPYKKIDEFLLKDRWEDINRWGWSKAAGLIRIMRENGYFQNIDLPSVIFVWLSVLLILLLKNCLYARHIIETHQPSEVIIFLPQSDYEWPNYSGNAFLNYFLADTVARKNIIFRKLKMKWDTEAFRPSQSKLKNVVRTILQKIIRRCYGILLRPTKKIDVLAHGALRHLGSVMIELKKRRAEVAFYDEEFHFEHFIFSLQNKMLYLIPECFPDVGEKYDHGLIDHLRGEVFRAFDAPFMKGHFLFDGCDLGSFVREKFFGKMNPFFKKIERDATQYEALLNSARIGSFLLHEDFNVKAFFAAFMKMKKIPIFCISHANWVIDCAIPQESRVFAQSYTFVLSQHEKDAYSERGWDPEKMIVTGIPRYDRLIKMTRDKVLLNEPVKILFCAGFFYPFSADTLGFLGLNIFCHQRHQKQAARMLVKAAEGLPVAIVIKPQFEEDETLWRLFAEKELTKGSVEVVKASEDYFKLLMESDAMSLCMWSSTIVEAGLANVPNFYLNLDGQDSGQVSRFSSSGLCEIFSDVSRLRQAFKKLCVSTRSRDSQRTLTPEQEYYLGRMDGKANVRVAEFILEKIGKN